MQCGNKKKEKTWNKDLNGIFIIIISFMAALWLWVGVSPAGGARDNSVAAEG